MCNLRNIIASVVEACALLLLMLASFLRRIHVCNLLCSSQPTATTWCAVSMRLIKCFALCLVRGPADHDIADEPKTE